MTNLTNLKMKTVVLCCAVAVAFAGGVAVGHWAWPNGDVDGAAEAGEDVTVEADEASDEEGGVVAQKGGENADGKFVEAVPAEPEKDDEDQAGEATVEEVRDEDGLTDEELREKFKRENPEEWERIQKRRRAMLDEMKKALANRKDFLAAIGDEFLSAEQRKVHAAYRTALTVREEARERIRKATASGGEADAEDYRLMNQADRTIRENAQTEHAALREALGRSLGLQGDELREFGETLKAIDDSVEHQGGGLLAR